MQPSIFDIQRNLIDNFLVVLRQQKIDLTKNLNDVNYAINKINSQNDKNNLVDAKNQIEKQMNQLNEQLSLIDIQNNLLIKCIADKKITLELKKQSDYLNKQMDVLKNQGKILADQKKYIDNMMESLPKQSPQFITPQPISGQNMSPLMAPQLMTPQLMSPQNMATQFMPGQNMSEPSDISFRLSSPQLANKKKFTTDDVNDYLEEAQEIYDDFSDAIIDNMKIQKIQEDKLLSEFVACSSLDSVHNHLSGLNPRKINDLLDKYFYSHEVMNSISCLFQSFLVNNAINPSESIKNYLDYIKLISVPSAYGVAMFGSLKIPSSQIFVIKTVKNIDKDNLAHESVVGLFGTNKLRKKIPNFSYVFGSFKCSLPFIDKEINSWCNLNLTKSNYILYEKVLNSVTYADFLKNATLKEYFQLLLQILYSLKIAHEDIDFTHYDLHAQNILIKKLPSSFAIKYDENVYIQSPYIATIIDYGSSHIKYNGLDYGNTDPTLYSFGIMRNKSNLLYDVYKIVVQPLAYMIKANLSLYSIVRDIPKYFNDTESTFDILENQNATYFIAPNYIDFDIKDFIEYVLNFGKKLGINVIVSKPTVPVLKCDECLKLDNILKDEGININGPIVIPETFYEFYDLHTYTKNTEVEKAFITGPPGLKPIDKAIKYQNNKIIELTKFIGNFDQQTPSLAVNYNYDYLVSMTVIMGNFMNAIQLLGFTLKIMEYINKLYNYPTLIKVIDVVTQILVDNIDNKQKCKDWTGKAINNFFTANFDSKAYIPVILRDEDNNDVLRNNLIMLWEML